MANEKTNREKVIDLLNTKRGLVGRQMGYDGIRMPTTGEAGLLFLDQVRVRWELDSNGKPNPCILLDLCEGDKIGEEMIPAELDKEFTIYAKEGKYPLRAHGLVTCVDAKDQSARWPHLYRLEPTLPEDCWDDPDRAKARLESVAGKLDRRPQGKPARTVGKLELDWNELESACNSKKPKLRRAEPNGKFGANYYQRHETPEGMTLWTGRLPYGWAELTPDKDNFVEIKPGDIGIVACFTPNALANLRTIVTKVMMPHIAFLRAAYYGGY